MPKRVLVSVPFPLDDEGVANRRLQVSAIDLGPDIQFDFEPVKAGAKLLAGNPDPARSGGGGFRTCLVAATGLEVITLIRLVGAGAFGEDRTCGPERDDVFRIL